MITTELVDYIKKQFSKSISGDVIISKLISAGWHKEDIDEGFLIIENESKKAISELPEKETSVIKEKNTEVEIFKEELPVSLVEEPKIIEKEIIDTPKIWTPMAVPVVEEKRIEIPKVNLEPENTIKIPEVINPKYFDTKTELIPTLKPKRVFNSFDSIVAPKKEIKAVNNSNAKNQPTKNSLVKNLPQSAMLSSYPTDSLSVNRENEELSKPKKRKFFKWAIFILIFLLAAGMVWFFANGETNFSLIKKDPKVLLLNSSKNLSTLKAYKTETSIHITLPSFFNITSGLVSGEAVESLDKDSFLINILGIMNKDKNDITSDTFITAKSSILEDYIISTIKENGPDLFISASSFNQVLNEKNSPSDFIKIKKNEVNLIPLLFKSEIQSKLNKINLYKILSNGMASYINSETLIEYNDLINQAEITEKGQGNIKGMDAYHYSISLDKKLLKKFFDKIIENYTSDLSKEEKENLNLILGSSTLNSFEIWIGKGDNNIYQYLIDLDTPLSKIIGFEDASIGDKKINFIWKTTYFDFDKINNISIPEDSISMSDFFNVIAEEKVKEDVISFEKLASALYKKERVYGKNSNKSGSCMNPVSGSIFSPVGHPKNVNTQISFISLLLKKILGDKNENAHCYSDPKAWSFTVPILNDYTKNVEEIKYNFCADSTGLKKELIEAPTGVVCK